MDEFPLYLPVYHGQQAIQGEPMKTISAALLLTVLCCTSGWTASGPERYRSDYSVWKTSMSLHFGTDPSYFKRFAEGKVRVWKLREVTIAKNEASRKFYEKTLGLFDSNPDQFSEKGRSMIDLNGREILKPGRPLKKIREDIVMNLSLSSKQTEEAKKIPPEFWVSVILDGDATKGGSFRLLDFKIPENLKYPLQALDRFNFKAGRSMADGQEKLSVYDSGEIVALDRKGKMIFLVSKTLGEHFLESFGHTSPGSKPWN